MHYAGDGLCLGLGGVLRLRVEDRLDFIAHGARLHLAGAHRGEQVLKRLVVHVARHGVERARRTRRGDAVSAFAKVAGEHLATGRGVLVLGRRSEVTADLGLGARRLDDVQPVARGLGVFIGEDLDAIAHGERVRKRSHGAVDLGAHAMVTDLGMYRVGKVERSGSHAQVHDLALGGEDEISWS